MKEIRFWGGVLSVLGLIIALAFFFSVWRVVIPFLIGLSIAYIVYPLVDPFVALGLRRDRVVLVLYILLLGTGVFLVFFFLPNLMHQAQKVGQELPSYAKTIDTATGNLNIWLRETVGRVLGPRAKAFEIPFRANTMIDALIMNLPSNLPNVAHLGVWFLIIPFVSFFGLTQGRRWLDNLFQVTPAEHVENLLGLLAEINATLGGYIRGMVMESISVGLLTMAGLSVLGIEGAVFLGVFTGIVNIVPFMAVLLGGALSILVAVFQGQPVSILFGIILLFACVRLFDDFVLIPFVIGHSVKLHPVLMLFAVLAGLELGGVLGLLVAVPATAVLKVVLSVLLRNRREQSLVRLNHVHI